jgi:cytochrome c peroxidase
MRLGIFCGLNVLIKMRFSVLFFSFLGFISACQKAETVSVSNLDDYVLQVPIGFPQPEIPADNLLTKSRIELGRRLFYDPILSLDSSRSCGSCHFLELAFSDKTATSLGIENRIGLRNTPSLANVIYQKKLLREGGVPTLEMQVLVPIQEHAEFDFNIVLAAERIKNLQKYVDLSQKAYNRAPDPFVITRSIAAFERTFLSGNSRFDQYLYQGKKNAISASEKRGFELFKSEKLNCATCHEGFLFTNQAFLNNGLSENYADSGRFRLTGLESDVAIFKVPSLRNVGLTAPFMHDGSILTLELVVKHYETGGKLHPNKSPLLHPFSISASERADLVAFLMTLTDDYFVNNPDFTKK